MAKLWTLLLVSLFALVGCTRRNEDLCCVGAADCAQLDIRADELKCAEGLTCIRNECVASSCENSGCTSAQPVCDLVGGACGGCVDNANCSAYSDVPVCDPSSGSCVGCVDASDCSASAPVCDDHACRACVVDSDCASGACAEDGSCVDPANAAYVAVGGVNGLCSQTAPCASIDFALMTTSPTRTHIVVGPGEYTRQVFINDINTPAPSLTIHGGGAVLHVDSDDGLMFTRKPLRMTDVVLRNATGLAFASDAPTIFSHVTVVGRIQNTTRLEIYDSEIAAAGPGIDIDNRGSLVVQRARIHGGTAAIAATNSSLVELTNVAITDTTDTALQLAQANGFMTFSTISFVGYEAMTTAGAVCALGSSFKVESSILWTPLPTPGLTKKAVDGCDVTTSIVGPVQLAGSVNFNPLFADPGAHDVHLSGGSPARGMAAAGPTLDFEGEARPQGPGFDIGADERE